MRWKWLLLVLLCIGCGPTHPSKLIQGTVKDVSGAHRDLAIVDGTDGLRYKVYFYSGNSPVVGEVWEIHFVYPGNRLDATVGIPYQSRFIKRIDK